MPPPHSSDTAMRREIRSTLHANATASYEIVLGNWRYREDGPVTPHDAARLQTIYAEEYAQRGGAAARQAARPWWRVW